MKLAALIAAAVLAAVAVFIYVYMNGLLKKHGNDPLEMYMRKINILMGILTGAAFSVILLLTAARFWL